MYNQNEIRQSFRRELTLRKRIGGRITLRMYSIKMQVVLSIIGLWTRRRIALFIKVIKKTGATLFSRIKKRVP